VSHESKYIHPKAVATFAAKSPWHKHCHSYNKNIMKTRILIAIGAAAGAALVVYLLRRSRANDFSAQNIPGRLGHPDELMLGG
jgi:hypothetical protein